MSTPSRMKTVMNMIMCCGMLMTSYCYPNDLDILSMCTIPLLIYCVIDIRGNSWDMVIHHISTLFAGLAMNYTYVDRDIDTATIVAKNLILTEISTVFLDLIHLGYRNLLIKLGFAITFTYFRAIRLPWVMVYDSDTCYFCIDSKDYVCGTNDLCHILWSVGVFNLLMLNTMWYGRLITKILKKNNPKPTIKE